MRARGGDSPRWGAVGEGGTDARDGGRRLQRGVSARGGVCGLVS